jgi:hypothetical protein
VNEQRYTKKVYGTRWSTEKRKLDETQIEREDEQAKKHKREEEKKNHMHAHVCAPTATELPLLHIVDVVVIIIYTKKELARKLTHIFAHST